MNQPSLRQIEAFRAVIETGTVSKAAEALGISQPAASKLCFNLEEDAGLQLFDRSSGRLVPTAQGMRFYEEIDRIFAGANQIGSAIEMIKREEQGLLKVGVLPSLSGRFIAQVLTRFSKRFPDVHIEIETRASQFLNERLNNHQLDIAITTSWVGTAEVQIIDILSMPIVCIMPTTHELKKRRWIEAQDLSQERVLTYKAGEITHLAVFGPFEKLDHKMEKVVEASMASTVCECVAAGLGISLMHPLLAHTVEKEVVIKPFVPTTRVGFSLCSPCTSPNIRLVAAFIEDTLAVANDFMSKLQISEEK